MGRFKTVIASFFLLVMLSVAVTYLYFVDGRTHEDDIPRLVGKAESSLPLPFEGKLAVQLGSESAQDFGKSGQAQASGGRVSIHVRRNHSDLILTLKEYDGVSPLVLSNGFSNSNNYAHLLNPRINFVKEDGGYPFASGLGNASSGDYAVHFPIFWFRRSPYAVLTEGFGASESVFLFPRFKRGVAGYDLDFSEMDIEVFNSALGAGKRFALDGEILFDSYFLFGEPKERCSRDYGNFRARVLSSPDFIWNGSFCSDTLAVFDYYYGSFGKPMRLKTNYTITFSSARQFGAMSTGMLVNRFDVDFIAHELFHLWQRPEGSCMTNVLYREGLATFMQYDSQAKSGIKGEKFIEATFSDLLANLSGLENLDSLYFLNQSQLLDIRREVPSAYDTLIYGKGALIWKRIADSGVSVNEVFVSSLKSGSCDEINKVIGKAERELYAEMMEDSSKD